MSNLVLKKVEFHRFPDAFGLGFTIGWMTFFQNYQSRNKVRWFSLTLHALFWQVTIRVPTKVYGIRECA